MDNRRELARLRITPSMSWGGAVTSTVSLEQTGSDFYVVSVEETQLTEEQRLRRVAVSEAEVKERLAVLKRSTVPAFPVSPTVCDGSYVELTVEGESSTLALGWWTDAPEGAECLSEFADWLIETGLPPDEKNDDQEE
ncbi:MAG TPA: hypothetical protein VLC92_10705 [Rhodocyclaceae bacterium]|nr:hypothetical protein [Rhodocyclaceae bacterium]